MRDLAIWTDVLADAEIRQVMKEYFLMINTL
jgi:hypothetical protein